MVEQVHSYAARLAAVCLLIFSCGGDAMVLAEPLRRSPNIVYIVADDLGYGELGCYGGTEIPTPHLDRMACDGARFTSGYVTAPFCAASRAALLTGRYQTRFGFEFNPIGAKNAEPGIGLPTSEKTLADRLRSKGYVTAAVGKWHLGGTAPFHPLRRGFDEFFGFLHEGHYFVPSPWKGVTTWLRRTALPDGSTGLPGGSTALPGQSTGRWVSPDGRIIWSTHLNSREPDYDADNPILRGSQPYDETDNLTDAFTRQACDVIDRYQTQPFFLYVSFNAVHSPMQGADHYMERFAHIEDIHRRIFAAMLCHLDESVGRIQAKLKECQLEEDTLLFFVSDNGGPTKELTSKNTPLRGGKGDLWEGGIRIPFLLNWKNTIPSGTVIHQPVSTMDVAMTACQAAHADRSNLDGVDLLSCTKDQAAAPVHEALFWRVGKKNAIRQGDWKLVRDGKMWQLYNLAQDLQEENDLAKQLPDRVEQMGQVWDQWNQEQIAPLW